MSFDTSRSICKENNWPLEAKEDKVYGPHGPTAGPPPYTNFGFEPLNVFGLPGMTGMDQFDPVRPSETAALGVRKRRLDDQPVTEGANDDDERDAARGDARAER